MVAKSLTKYLKRVHAETKFDKLKTYAVLLFLLSIVLRLIYGIYCKRNFRECSYRPILDRNLIAQMTGFAGWSLFGLVAYSGYNYGLNILLNLFFSMGMIRNLLQNIGMPESKSETLEMMASQNMLS